MSQDDDLPIRVSAELKAEIPADVQRDVVTFAQRIFGPIAELGDLLSDRIRFARFKQTIWILQRAKALCATADIEPKRIPLNILIPLLEKASLEDDSQTSLRELWANLLANAAKEPDKKYTRYASMLSELSFSEAKILSDLKKQTSRHELFKPDNIGALIHPEINMTWDGSSVQSLKDLEHPGRVSFHVHEDLVANTNEVSFSDLEEAVMLLHLHNLGLMKTMSGSFLTPSGAERQDQKRIFFICGDITPSGFDFVSSCESTE